MQDREMRKFLKQTVRQAGGEYELTRNNHWRVSNPATGGVTFLALTPSSKTWRQEALYNLRSIGLEVR